MNNLYSHFVSKIVIALPLSFICHKGSHFLSKEVIILGLDLALSGVAFENIGRTFRNLQEVMSNQLNTEYNVKESSELTLFKSYPGFVV